MPAEATDSVDEFVLNDGSIDLRRASVSATVDWHYPGLPEDRCLLGPDGTAWFQSTVHEAWAASRITAEEAAALERPSPSLYRLLAEPRVPTT